MEIYNYNGKKKITWIIIVLAFVIIAAFYVFSIDLGGRLDNAALSSEEGLQ